MKSNSITLSDLSPALKDELFKQLKAEEDLKLQAIKDNRKAYKDLVNETIPILFHDLLGLSSQLSEMKTKIISELKALIKMKADVFGREDNKYSHSFTTDDGITLMIGTRYSDAWDDTVTAGIEKINKYLESLGTDENSKRLVTVVMRLLSKDSKGNLKASKVLQLGKIAEEWKNADFMDGVNIIHDAYRPTKSQTFITCRYKGNDGELLELPLDITSAELDFIIPLAYDKSKKEDTTEPKA